MSVTTDTGASSIRQLTIAVFLQQVTSKGAVFRTGAILFRDGGDLETGADFSNETDPPAGDFISEGGDFWRGRLYFVTPAAVEPRD